MLLLADSGSSKTDWRIKNAQGKILQAQTPGLNPYTIDKEEFIFELNKLPLTEEVEKIFFYGAGCGSEETKNQVAQWLSEVFVHAQISVESDMLGAARGSAGHQPALVAILGTGSNACLYDGQNIVYQSPSNGVWFGDEGSGAHLGKRLVADFLDGKLPADVGELWRHRFGLSRGQVLDAIYRQPKPNVFLAGFVPFILAHITHPYFSQLVGTGFEEFLEKRVKTIPNHQGRVVHFVGSVAFRFANILQRIVVQSGLLLGRIIEKPIAGLSLYHGLVS